MTLSAPVLSTGYAAAIGSLIFAITMLCGVAQLWYTRRRRVLA